MLEIEDGKLNFYDGGYTFYNSEKSVRRESRKKEEEARAQEKRNEEQKASYRSKRERAEEAKRKEAVKKIESDICGLEERENEINALLADPVAAADYKRVSALSQELQSIKLQLDALYAEYENMI